MSEIMTAKDLCLWYGDNKALKDINIAIPEKSITALIGPSGCGKTTTLRIIAGFLQPDSGEVIFDGKVINDVPPHKRQVNTIFQRYALFPHLNVYENIAFGLRLQKKAEKEIKETVTEPNEYGEVVSKTVSYPYMEAVSYTHLTLPTICSV